MQESALRVQRCSVTGRMNALDSHVLRGVGEELGVLGRRVFWTVGCCVTDHHHHRAVRVHALRHAEIVDTVVGDQISEVVLEEWRKKKRK